MGSFSRSAGLMTAVVCTAGSLSAQFEAEPDCGAGISCTSTPLATGYGIGLEQEAEVAVTTSTSGQSQAAPSDLGLDGICTSTAMSAGLDPYAHCGLEPGAEAPQLTAEMVAAAFARVSLPPSRLIVQPPNGRTLVNFETNFYTDNAPFDVAPLRLLGHRVEIHVVPSVWTWRFGDGASVVTDRPGSAYPRLDITHRYLTKGRVVVSLDTTYRGRYRVDGGGWNDVQGEVTIPGDPAELEVVTATPTLVGY